MIADIALPAMAVFLRSTAALPFFVEFVVFMVWNGKLKAMRLPTGKSFSILMGSCYLHLLPPKSWLQVAKDVISWVGTFKMLGKL